MSKKINMKLKLEWSWFGILIMLLVPLVLIVLGLSKMWSPVGREQLAAMFLIVIGIWTGFIVVFGLYSDYRAWARREKSRER